MDSPESLDEYTSFETIHLDQLKIGSEIRMTDNKGRTYELLVLNTHEDDPIQNRFYVQSWPSRTKYEGEFMRIHRAFQKNDWPDLYTLWDENDGKQAFSPVSDSYLPIILELEARYLVPKEEMQLKQKKLFQAIQTLKSLLVNPVNLNEKEQTLTEESKRIREDLKSKNVIVIVEDPEDTNLKKEGTPALVEMASILVNEVCEQGTWNGKKSTFLAVIKTINAALRAHHSDSGVGSMGHPKFTIQCEDEAVKLQLTRNPYSMKISQVTASCPAD